MTDSPRAFEIGPIRPPSEAESLLLRITRNCSWNKCKFCRLYKEHKFSTRSIEDIKADIDQVAACRDDIAGWPSDGAAGYHFIRERLSRLPQETAERYLYVLQWMSGGGESVFLQDANTMVLTYDKLKEILLYLREKLPHVKRVTSYSRVDALAKFSQAELEKLKKAGLDRIHSGYESGSDKVLSLINKGCTKAQEIEAGQKVKASGIELSVYFMPGVGGKELSDDNADETADVVSRVNPDFVRIRTFVSKPGTELLEDIQSGRMTECTDTEKMRELKRMIQSIKGADGFLYSDHIINLLEEVRGNLNTDKEDMLSVFSSFEKLDLREQRRYQLARRMGMIRSPEELAFLSGEQQEKVDMYLSQLDAGEKFEAFLLRLLRRYI